MTTKKRLHLRRETPGPDIAVSDHGSIMLFSPKNDSALNWLLDRTDGTWFGDSLAVEPRFAADLAQGARDDAGFSLEFRT